MPQTFSILGAILDVDGTLIDSNDAHARAWKEALDAFSSELGSPPPTLDEIRSAIGMGGDQLLPALAGVEPESDLGRRISTHRGDNFRKDRLPRLDVFPGTRELLERMRGDGIRLIIATSARDEDLQPMLERIGVADLVESSVTADDADRSKPDPDLVVAALRQLGLPANRVLMLGDTPYDIQAARRAGVQTVALRSGGWRDPDLSGAAAVYDSPADLLARYEHSPFHRAQGRAPRRAIA